MFAVSCFLVCPANVLCDGCFGDLLWGTFRRLRVFPFGRCSGPRLKAGHESRSLTDVAARRTISESSSIADACLVQSQFSAKRACEGSACMRWAHIWHYFMFHMFANKKQRCRLRKSVRQVCLEGLFPRVGALGDQHIQFAIPFPTSTSN